MRIWQTSKQKTIITTYKKFRKTCIKSKKEATYIQCVSTIKGTGSTIKLVISPHFDL